MGYLMEVLIAIDQLINTVLGGYADETLSARAYRAQSKHKRWRIARQCIDAIFFWQDEHCFQAYTAELLRIHTPIETRNLPAELR